MRTLLLGVLLVAPLVAQPRTFVVDIANGPGTDFVELAAALASPLVRDGDVLRVRPGGYQAPAPFGKAVSILGDGPGVVIGHPLVAGALTVEGLAANKDVAIKGVRLAAYSAPLTIRNCLGRVLLDQVEVQGRDLVGIGGEPPGLRVHGGAQVAIQSSQITGGVDVDAGSRVFCVDSHIRGAHSVSFGHVPVPGGAGIAVRASTLVLAHTVVTGGDYRSSFLHASAGAGIVAIDAVVEVRGDAGATVAAGADGGGRPVPALVGAGRTTLVHDPAVTLQPTGGASALSGAFASVVVRRMPALLVVGAPLGGVVRTGTYSPQGDLVVFALGLPASGTVVPGIRGVVHLALSGPILAATLGTQGPGEHLFHNYRVPADPALVGRAFTQQFVSGTAANGFEWTNPSTFVVD